MFGFLIRLGLIFLAVMLVKDAGWVELVPLGLKARFVFEGLRHFVDLAAAATAAMIRW